MVGGAGYLEETVYPELGAGSSPCPEGGGGSNP